jgi:hypothetical protein
MEGSYARTGLGRSLFARLLVAVVSILRRMVRVGVLGPLGVIREAIQAPQLYRHVFIDRAGMRLLFTDAQFGEPVKDFVSLDFQLPCQLVNPNLLHRKMQSAAVPGCVLAAT